MEEELWCERPVEADDGEGYLVLCGIVVDDLCELVVDG